MLAAAGEGLSLVLITALETMMHSLSVVAEVDDAYHGGDRGGVAKRKRGDAFRACDRFPLRETANACGMQIHANKN